MPMPMPMPMPKGPARCRFLGCRTEDRRTLATLELEGRRFEALVSNPEVLHGDLPCGAEIEVLLGDASPLPAVELRVSEEDRVPSALVPLFRGLYAAPFGLARRTDDGWNYVFIEEGEKADRLVEGPLELHGFMARFHMASEVVELRKRWLDRIAESLPAFPLAVSALSFPDSPVLGDEIPELRPEDLEPSRLEALARDLEHSHYWSDRYDPAFYRAQARAGFIAITMDRGDRVFLAPELQEAYAVLDWENLHRSRSLARLFRSGRLEALGARLVASTDIEPVLRGLARQWEAHTWLRPDYVRMLRGLAAERGRGLELVGVELRVDAEEEPVAGELGYTIGRTYTSLSGFRRRDRREWSDLGKVQLQLLAGLLRDRGYAFWNLGHPYMQYKLDLGARVLGRAVFLERWGRAIAEEDPGLGGEPRL